jgi:hypothetical protein
MNAAAPPILWIHGTKDPFFQYSVAAAFINSVRAPKGMLTLVGATHGEWLSRTDSSFSMVLSTAVTFFDAWLRSSTQARATLARGSQDASHVLQYAVDASTHLVIATPTAAKTDRHVVVTPSTGLTGGQQVVVTWSGFTPGQTVNIIQCVNSPNSTAASCEISAGKVLTPDPAGSGSATLKVISGNVGNGKCGPGLPACNITVNDSGSPDPAATIRVPISFGR